MVKEFAVRHGSALRSLAVLVGLLATVAAVVVGAVLLVVFTALLGFAGLALRARRTAQSRAGLARNDGVIEARHLGGHHWVAYGWNESR
jgi:hypothetical protein